MKSVAVLCAKPNSVYLSKPQCEVYDIKRNALTFDHALPVVAHPPCRLFGRLAWKAKPREGEYELALFCAEAVKRCGGVLEHPAHSKLWSAASLPAPGDFTGHGFTLPVMQQDFAHRAPKPTWLYIVGVSPRSLPRWQMRLGFAEGRIELMGKPEREATPEPFADFLLAIARRAAVAEVAA